MELLFVLADGMIGVGASLRLLSCIYCLVFGVLSFLFFFVPVSQIGGICRFASHVVISIT